MSADAPLMEGEATRSGRWRRATWARWALPLVPVVAAVVVFTVVLRQDQPEAPPVTLDQIDIDEVSTETLESLVATYADDPEFADEMPGIELVLAERHFTTGAYDRAFELYAGIIEDPQTRSEQFAVSLSRLGWIAWLTTGDSVTALQTVDQALRVDPTNAETSYIKGQILWCGIGDHEAAVELFETVLRAPDLPDDVRLQVDGDLEAAAAGTDCR